MNFDGHDDKTEVEMKSENSSFFNIIEKLTVKGCPEQTEGCLESPKGEREVQLEDKELVDPL